MKYSNAVKTMLFASINTLIANPENYAVCPGKDFSRNRKLGLRDLILLLLTMEADCIKEELYHYFGRTANAPSKAAFYKQRQKLMDDALRSLLISFNRKCKKHLPDGKYSLIACDGSAADIFRNPKDPDTFFEPNGKSTKGFNQIHIHSFFSILDKKFTDLVIQPGRKRNEYSAFCQMADRCDAPNPVIYLCDRGYASYNNFAHVIENLITNLPDIEFDLNDFKELYHLRWNEETAYRDLKYPLCLKAFHSKKYDYIVQEVWARAILYNFCSEISMHVEIPKKNRKHTYQINFSEAIKICRDFLRDDTLALDAEGLIAQNIEAVRPGRTFARQARFKLPMSFCYRN